MFARLMRFSFFSFLLVYFALISGKSYGQEVLVFEKGDRVVLEQTSCNSQFVLQRTNPAVHAQLKTATFVYRPDAPPQARGKTVNGCWLMHEEMVVTLWEDGDVLQIPLDKFKPGDASSQKTGVIL